MVLKLRRAGDLEVVNNKAFLGLAVGRTNDLGGIGEGLETPRILGTPESVGWGAMVRVNRWQAEVEARASKRGWKSRRPPMRWGKRKRKQEEH
jgi:hypothetical protein